MKVLHLSTSDIKGGAAIAANRLHHALNNETNIFSRMMVARYFSNDQTIYPAYSCKSLLLSRVRCGFANILRATLHTENKIIHSPSLFPSLLVNKINNSDYDIIHLHWIQSEFISISDIARIKKPIVWTFHDMWPFCGAEHYSFDDRWLHGYKSNNRPQHESGFDLNKWCWKRKQKFWKNSFNIIAPSGWMLDKVSRSPLFSGFPAHLVHNPIDLNFWTLLDKKLSQKEFSLPSDTYFILFGASGGRKQFHKGFDLLENSLGYLRKLLPNRKLCLIIFGDDKPEDNLSFNLPVIHIGSLSDQSKLKALYNAVDCLVVPSRLDNLPNMAIESISCSTPVIAFNIGGLSDIISHKHNGYLAKPFDCKDLACGIKYVLDNRDILSYNARAYACTTFGSSLISKKIGDIYKQILIK